MSLSLVLSNGSTIELADATFTKHYVVNCSDYADYHYINTSGTMYSLFGGRTDDGLDVGAFCVHLSNGSASAYWTIAAALSCKPLAGKNPETNFKNISLPALPTLSGTNTLSFETTVQPSKVYVKYKG